MFLFYKKEKYSLFFSGILQTSVPAMCFFTLVTVDVSNQTFCMVSVPLPIAGMDWWGQPSGCYAITAVLQVKYLENVTFSPLGAWLNRINKGFLLFGLGFFCGLKRSTVRWDTQNTLSSVLRLKIDWRIQMVWLVSFCFLLTMTVIFWGYQPRDIAFCLSFSLVHVVSPRSENLGSGNTLCIFLLQSQ